MKNDIIKNLIIGGNGFIGSELSSFLIEKGQETKCFGRRGSNEDVRFCQIPLSEFDMVYFTAWDLGGSKYLYSKDNYQIQIENNVKILSNTIPQLIKYNKPFVFVSSFAAEFTDNPYGITKKMAEMWLERTPCRIIRIGNIYGKIKENNEKSDVISDFITQAIFNNVIKMNTNGEEKRQFIYYRDAVNAIKTVSEQSENGIYDTFYNSEWISIIQVAEIIANLTGSDIIKGKQKGVEREVSPRKNIKDFSSNISILDGLSKTIGSFLSKKNYK